MAAEVISLGCRLNLSESEELRGLLAQEADLVVINSCAVTAEAVRQTGAPLVDTASGVESAPGVKDADLIAAFCAAAASA
jgi:tRNA A37 methylthiotransferase MiaB